MPSPELVGAHLTPKSLLVCTSSFPIQSLCTHLLHQALRNRIPDEVTNSWAVDSKDQGSDSSSEDEGSSAEVQSNGNISSRSSAGDAEESDEDKGDVAEPEDQDMAGSSDSSANNSEYEPIIDHEDIEKCKELSKMAKARRDKRSKLDYAV